MDDELLTGRALYERLRALFPDVTSDEELGHMLGANAKQISRLKQGFGSVQISIIELLNIAGWLHPTTDVPREEEIRSAELLARARYLAKHRKPQA